MQKPVERLKRKVQKENLWVFILSLISKKKRYAYEIRELVKNKHGFLTGNVTAYKVLYLLEKGKYVKSYFIKGKKYYRITNTGKEQLRKAKMFFKKMSSEF